MKTYNVWRNGRAPQTIKSDDFLSLKVMQGIVGGLIEVYQAGKTIFIFDEEGKLKDKEPNNAFPAFVGTVITTQNGLELE